MYERDCTVPIQYHQFIVKSSPSSEVKAKRDCSAYILSVASPGIYHYGTIHMSIISILDMSPLINPPHITLYMKQSVRSTNVLLLLPLPPQDCLTLPPSLLTQPIPYPILYPAQSGPQGISPLLLHHANFVL
jgi:hypothetical protein